MSAGVMVCKFDGLEKKSQTVEREAGMRWTCLIVCTPITGATVG